MRSKPSRQTQKRGGVLALLMLALAVLACNLGASAPTPTPQFVFPSATPFFFSTATPQPRTSTPFPTSAPPPCTVRTDWRITYTVVAGDTLGTIATRTGVSIDDLADGNCLTNINLITVGQRLRVPRTPAILTPTTSSGQIPGAPTIAGLTVSPAISRGPNQYQVSLGTVTISALGVSNANRVTFYVAQTGSAPTILGEDTNINDGVSVPLTILSNNFQATVFAVAANAAGQMAQSATIVIQYDAGAVPSIGALTIQPSSTVPNQPGAVGIRPGVVTVSVSAVLNATRVTFYFVSTTSGSTPVVIGVDENPADGAAIAWTVTAATVNTSGLVWAVASNATDQAANTASTPVVFLP